MHSDPIGELLERGVWVAPWKGPHGELVLLGVTADGRLATGAPYVVPNGIAQSVATDRLWREIEEAERWPRLALHTV